MLVMMSLRLASRPTMKKYCVALDEERRDERGEQHSPAGPAGESEAEPERHEENDVEDDVHPREVAAAQAPERGLGDALDVLGLGCQRHRADEREPEDGDESSAPSRAQGPGVTRVGWPGGADLEISLAGAFPGVGHGQAVRGGAQPPALARVRRAAPR